MRTEVYCLDIFKLKNILVIKTIFILHGSKMYLIY